MTVMRVLIKYNRSEKSGVFHHILNCKPSVNTNSFKLNLFVCFLHPMFVLIVSTLNIKLYITKEKQVYH